MNIEEWKEKMRKEGIVGKITSIGVDDKGIVANYRELNIKDLEELKSRSVKPTDNLSTK
jgi:hypothetical protein